MFLYRDEVGLLTCNVIIQGSLQDSNPFEGQGADQYGLNFLPIDLDHNENQSGT